MGWPIIAAAAISAVAAAKQSADAKAAAQGGQVSNESSTESTTGVNTKDPYAPFQPALTQIGSGINQAVQTPWTLPNQTYAGTDPLQTQGLDMRAALSAPGGPLASIGQEAYGAYSQALDPMSGINAATLGPLDVYAQNVGRNLREVQLPGISQAATAAGQQGSSRQGIAEGIASRGGAEAISNYGKDLVASLYGQGVNSRNAALGLTGDIQGAQGYAGQNLYDVGTAQQGLTQAQLDDMLMRQQYFQNEPFARYGAAADIAYGGAQLGGTETAQLDTTKNTDYEYTPQGKSDFNWLDPAGIFS